MNSKHIAFQIEQHRAALDKLHTEIGALQAEITSGQSERRTLQDELHRGYVELAHLQAEAEEHGNSGELARKMAKQQAEIAKLESRLQSLPATPDEWRLHDLCMSADMCEGEILRLQSKLGWAVLAEAEAELKELDDHARAATDEAEAATKAAQAFRNVIPAKVAQWPEVRAAAERKYHPTPATPPKGNEPTRAVLSAFVAYVDALQAYGKTMERVVGNTNVAAILAVSEGDVELATNRLGAGAGNVFHSRRERAERLLRALG